MQNFIVDLDNAQKLGEYLRNLRDSYNLTIREVSKKTGINTADLSRIESGLKERVNPLHLLELARVYKINVIELYLIIGYLEKSVILKYSIKTNVQSKTEENLNKLYSEIPLYDGKESFLNYPSKFIQVTKEKKEFEALSILDESMKPILYKEDIVLFNKNEVNLLNGSIGFFILNGNYLVRIFYKFDDIIVLESYNREVLPILVKEKDTFSIVGHCIEKLSFSTLNLENTWI